MPRLGRENPGILAIDDEYEFTAVKCNKQETLWYLQHLFLLLKKEDISVNLLVAMDLEDLRRMRSDLGISWGDQCKLEKGVLNARAATVMDEKASDTLASEQSLPLVCEKSALSVNNEESLLPIISSTQLSSSEDLPSICDKSSVPENDEVGQLCDVADKLPISEKSQKNELCVKDIKKGKINLIYPS